jgi:hypothetical protein
MNPRRTISVNIKRINGEEFLRLLSLICIKTGAVIQNDAKKKIVNIRLSDLKDIPNILNMIRHKRFEHPGDECILVKMYKLRPWNI